MTQPEAEEQAMRIPITKGEPGDAGRARAEARNAPPRPNGALVGPHAASAAQSAPNGDQAPKEAVAAPAVRIPAPLVIGAEPRLTSAPVGLPADPAATMPDTVLDGANLPGLAVRGASIRGDDHRYLGVTRQDAIGIAALADGKARAWLACVADGVGSEPKSQLGSAEACALLRQEAERRLPALLAAEPDQELAKLCQNMAERVAERLADYGRNLRIDPKSLSTTLAGAVIEAEPAPGAERVCVVFAVGDSTALLLRNGTFHALLADPHEGVIASPGTSALPTSPGTVTARRVRIRKGDMLMVCTDGLSNPMHNAAVTGQLARWWGGGSVPELPEFGWQLSFRAKSYGDDRSAVCVWGV